MKCRKCKQLIPDESRFCNLCGADQQPPERKPKGRGNGQGSVYKCGKAYRAEVQVCKPQRKRMTRNGFRTRAEALAAIPAMRAELLGSRAKKKGAVTLSGLYVTWDDSAAQKLSSSKQTAYKIAYKRLASIADAPIAELTIEDLQKCVDGLTYYPARDVKVLLSHLYKRALAQQDVGANLAPFIVLPELIEDEAVPFNDEEIKAMWQAWNNGDPFVGYALLMIYTGMMPGELLACKKDMIDFDNQKIVGCGKKTKERKSKPIMIPDIVMPVLRKLCGNSCKSLIAMGKDKWYDEYHAMTGRVGIRDLPPYSCRHTTATAMALGDAVAPALITRVMRQKRAATTERYKHADEQQVLEALNKLAVSPITKT